MSLRLRLRPACVVVLAMMAASAARAQDAGALAREMVGQWELATAERGKTCVLTLATERAANGMQIELDGGCAAALPFTRDIAAWSVKGLDIVRLQNAAGEPVIDLTEVESGIFEGVRTGEGVYLMQNLAAARALTRSMDQMIGEWALVRGSGRTICNMTLTNTEADNDNFKVFLNSGCGPLVTGFNPVMWRLERGEIILIAANGQTWHFQADDNAQWRRVPEEADPLLLMRQ
ncbi:MAG: peptidase [Proteobacteria bacterium]|nr:MAG: peptidase [Pseudomonadota bacterium]